MRHEYLALDAMATRLALPKTYLRRLAKDGILPHLNINGRLRFDETAVREALRDLARRDEGGADES